MKLSYTWNIFVKTCLTNILEENIDHLAKCELVEWEFLRDDVCLHKLFSQNTTLQYTEDISK